jgi:diguanylate cyclase (GGDEF)-like protein
MGLDNPSQQVGLPRPENGPVLESCAICLGVCVLVVLIESTMHWVGFFDAGQAVWWPTNALALALMLRSERRRWPAVLSGTLLGSLTGQIYYGYPIGLDFGNFLANGIGPLLIALMLPRFRKLEDWLQEPQLVARFVMYALILAPALSATIFATCSHLVIRNSSLWEIAHRRAVADMLGYAMFTPLALVIAGGRAYRPGRVRKSFTTFLLVIMVLFTTTAVFSQKTYPVTFVLASMMLLVAMHLGFRASVVIVNLLAALATAATMHGYGPLVLGAGAEMGTRIILLQMFLTLSMVTVFSISVIQLEREMFQTKLQLAYGEMEVLATIDALTGVANRRRFQEVLDKEWSRASRTGEAIAVLMIDVDHFKAYNDVHGHLAGDECLRIIARTLLENERRTSDLLARYGGEEFVLLLPSTSLEGAAQIAETLRAKVEGLSQGNLKRPVTISIGCAAMSPIAGLSAMALIGASDEALYLAKKNGRNRVEIARNELTGFAAQQLSEYKDGELPKGTAKKGAVSVT